MFVQTTTLCRDDLNPINRESYGKKPRVDINKHLVTNSYLKIVFFSFFIFFRCELVCLDIIVETRTLKTPCTVQEKQTKTRTNSCTNKLLPTRCTLKESYSKACKAKHKSMQVLCTVYRSRYILIRRDTLC